MYAAEASRSQFGASPAYQPAAPPVKAPPPTLLELERLAWPPAESAPSAESAPPAGSAPPGEAGLPAEDVTDPAESAPTGASARSMQQGPAPLGRHSENQPGWNMDPEVSANNVNIFWQGLFKAESGTAASAHAALNLIEGKDDFASWTCPACTLFRGERCIIGSAPYAPHSPAGTEHLTSMKHLRAMKHLQPHIFAEREMTEFFSHVTEEPMPNFDRITPPQAFGAYVARCGGDPDRTIAHFTLPGADTAEAR